MKVSVNWIKQFIDFELPPIDELVARIGAQLGGVEHVEALSEKYKGAVIVKVVSCEPHPDSDHMHVCRIDDGGKTPEVARSEDGFVQVVCGAPNVRTGLTVVWLPPGSTVPESYDKEPFVLGARELRGVISNGMLASSRELALGDSHEGILELEDDKTPGMSFAEAYQLDDYIIEIENKMFTHRPDCFGQLGVAREIAGILGKPFTSPDWYLRTSLEQFQLGDAPALDLSVHNELPALVPRFIAVAMGNVTIKPSPFQLQTWLLRCGVRPINNVVDVTNYMMILTGQPLHAYDYDKLRAQDSEAEAATLIVRHPRSNETITLLNGKTIEPRPEAIMISTAHKLVGVGGIMGGSETEVDEGTKNIVLEAATFDMYSIRRTSMAHGLFTDAVARFNKGQSPLQNDEVAAKAVELFKSLSGAQVASKLIDIDHTGVTDKARRWVHPPVVVAATFINNRLGVRISAQEMKSLLENVECSVQVEDEQLLVAAPYWRTDIETREDVVEEVGRLYGFDKLPLELPLRSIKPATKDALLELKSKVRTLLAKAGANEVLSYSFVHGSLLDRVGQDKTQAFQVSNALSPDLQYYRLSLTPSLLTNVHPNIKAGYEQFVLFEIGKAHNIGQFDEATGLPTEFEMLDVVYAATEKAGAEGAAFYQARNYLVYLAAGFGLELEFRPFETEEEYQVVKPYDSTRSAKIFVKDTDLSLGMVGEYKPAVSKNLKLPKYTAGFEIGLTQLAEAATNTHAYVPLPRFPGVAQDVTLTVESTRPYADVWDEVRMKLEDSKPENSLLQIIPGDIYQSSDDPAHKHVTFRIVLASYDRTLTDKEVAILLGRVN